MIFVAVADNTHEDDHHVDEVDDDDDVVSLDNSDNDSMEPSFTMVRLLSITQVLTILAMMGWNSLFRWLR